MGHGRRVWFEKEGERHPCFAEGDEGRVARNMLADGAYVRKGGSKVPGPFRRFMQFCERKAGGKEEHHREVCVKVGGAGRVKVIPEW